MTLWHSVVGSPKTSSQSNQFIQFTLQIKNSMSVFSVAKSCPLQPKAIPANIYLFKVNNGNTKTINEICLKLIIKTPERCH